MCFFVWVFGVEGVGIICEELCFLFLLLVRLKEDCGKGDVMSVLFLYMVDLEEIFVLGLGSICFIVIFFFCLGF